MKSTLFVSLVLIICSCKKYDDNKKFSVYSVNERLIKKGAWQIVSIEDLTSNQKKEMQSSFLLNFKDDKFEIIDISTLSPYTIGGTDNYSDFLKPSIEGLMQDPSYILHFSANDYESNYSLSDDKNKILLTDFITGYETTFNTYWKERYSLEFEIKRLEFGYMTLVYDNKLKINFKKIATENKK